MSGRPAPRVALLGVSAVLLAAGASADESLPEVETRLREAREEARSIEVRAGGVLDEIERLDREIETSARDADRLGEQSREAAAREEEARRRVTSLDRELEAVRDRLLERATALVRLSQRGLGPVLFRRLGEAADARRRQTALRAVLDRDRRLLAEARATREAAEAAREEAARAAAGLAARRRAAEEERERLRARRAAKATVLASLRSEADERERLAGELEAAAVALRRLLERETGAAPEAPAPPRAAEESGGFRSPLDVVAGVERSRNGVEIPVASGGAVYAVAAGRVVFADWFPGYGKMVIVDHGKHLHSVYGYAGEIVAGRGTVVRAGDVLARTGSTGLAPSARLYFEMREKGVPQPPGRYIPVLAVRAAGPN